MLIRSYVILNVVIAKIGFFVLTKLFEHSFRLVKQIFHADNLLLVLLFKFLKKPPFYSIRSVETGGAEAGRAAAKSYF